MKKYATGDAKTTASTPCLLFFGASGRPHSFGTDRTWNEDRTKAEDFNLWPFVMKDGFKRSQTLHVWYIYLHWGDLGGQCRDIFHTWSVWGLFVAFML